MTADCDTGVCRIISKDAEMSDDADQYRLFDDDESCQRKRKIRAFAMTPCTCERPLISDSVVQNTRHGAWKGESVKYRKRNCARCGGYFRTFERPDVPENFVPLPRKPNNI